MRCREGTDSPSKVLSGRTSGVLLVLLLEEPEMEAWTEATALAWSGGTYLRGSLNSQSTLHVRHHLVRGMMMMMMMIEAVIQVQSLGTKFSILLCNRCYFKHSIVK